MYLRRLKILSMSFLASWLPSANAVAPHFKKIPLGDEVVLIESIQNGLGKAFVHVHQNETTALKAARHVIQEDGGSLLTLHHSGGRNIVFHLEGERYEFDPNRMFTDVGIQETLIHHGAYSHQAHHAVKQLATAFIKAMPQNQRIIAVHNNQDYSLKLYLKGEELAHEAAALNYQNGSNLRNFYLVTQFQDFLTLKQKGYNGLLQSEQTADDGSLSIYLSKQPYVNVEAAYGAFDTQVAMLRAI